MDSTAKAVSVDENEVSIVAIDHRKLTGQTAIHMEIAVNDGIENEESLTKKLTHALNGGSFITFLEESAHEYGVTEEFSSATVTLMGTVKVMEETVSSNVSWLTIGGGLAGVSVLMYLAIAMFNKK